MFCFHDLTARSTGPEDFADQVLAAPAEVVGASDSGLLFDLEAYRTAFRARGFEPRVILIKRQPQICERSMVRVCGIESAESVIDQLRRVTVPGPRLAVEFDSLNERLPLLWDEATRLPFPVEHAAKMLTLNVQVHPHIMAHAAKTGGVLSC